MVNEIFTDFNLTSRFQGINRERKLVFINIQGVSFGMGDLSAGEKQILGKIFPLFTDETREKVILMDEPEESLHPSWQSCLLPVLRRCAKENDCQFILATHSPQIISAARKEELRLLVSDENNKIKAVTCSEGSYGWTVEKVLSEIQHVQHFRVPEVENKLEELCRMIQEKRYETDAFRSLWNEMEELLGYSDKDLILMRMEIIRKKKVG
jgi:predicted ATP-binding protein involved in virulence